MTDALAKKSESISRKRAFTLVVSGILLALVYKGWKAWFRQHWQIDPQADYLVYQSLATVFRAVNAGLGAVLFFKLVPFPGYFFSTLNRKTCWLLLAYLVTYSLIRLAFYDLTLFKPDNFFFELVFNSMTGISEEIVFRGLIFFGLLRLVSGPLAVGGSSLLFSLWHYDVYTGIADFVFLFFAGVVDALAFSSGVGLLFLALMHFIWDQITFGLVWENGHYLGLFMPAMIGHSLCFAAVLGFSLRQQSVRGQGGA